VFAHKVAKLAGTAIVAGALGLAAAGTASALSSADDQFLNELQSEGIGYDSPKAAIENGHYVCASFDDGASIGELGHEILANSDLTTRQAAAFIVTAVGSYCPEHTDLFS
jgi:hypothetical protein